MLFRSSVDVSYIDLQKLGVVPQPLKHDLAFTFDGEIKRDSIAIDFASGDLKLDLGANMGLDMMIKKSTDLADKIISQISSHSLNIDELRQMLPDLTLDVSAGKNNVLAWYLDTQKMSYNDIDINLEINNISGINGDLSIHTFKLDTLQLDTIYFDIKQDTNCVV